MLSGPELLLILTPVTVGTVVRPSTLWLAWLPSACVPSDSVALVPPPLRIVPLLRPSAPAAMLMPSASKFAAPTSYSNVSIVVPLPLA